MSILGSAVELFFCCELLNVSGSFIIFEILFLLIEGLRASEEKEAKGGFWLKTS